MENDKTVVELLFILSLFSLSLTFFPGLIKDSVEEVEYFKGNRASRCFNVLGVPKDNSIEFYAMSGSIGNIDTKDIPNGSPITRAIHDLYKSKKKFTIYINPRMEIIHIYSQCVIPRYIFKIKEVPSMNQPSIEIIKRLDSLYLPDGPMDQKLIQTLVYLGLKGRLENKLFILYENILVIINEKKQMILFNMDLEHLFGMMLKETSSRKDEKENGLNRLLIAFKIESNILFFCDPRNDRREFGKKMTGNTLAKGTVKLFPSSKDIQIKSALRRDDYGKLCELVSDEERKEGMCVLEKVIIDPIKPDESSFF
ncbi:hypothetical protein EROM_111420 [Encephalitozoon romaleae SJ-2008]|uniref:Uncharacterized protein n=1 Tax=Encephalitozoon romaleae (strain SJ-2008) TaxID=1178016 RepID=I6ZLD2_ENCRO|nr:hypothetical protein EROM_111420 [Encephalitozoon romaleae SJ-2008]AFN84123.1 hypothetical protein EROM_111420 [Encephalitozoon romaleae SJ-2008]